MKKQIILTNLLVVGAVALSIGAIMTRNSFENLSLTDAATTATNRTITFKKGVTAVTTAGKNKVSSHWIKQCSGSKCNNNLNYYAYLKATMVMQGGEYVETRSLLGIYGPYKFNKITKIAISYAKNGDYENKYCGFCLYSLKNATTTDKFKSIDSVYGSEGSYSTVTINDPFSGAAVYGIAFKTYISGTKNHITTTNVWINQVSITYTC